MTTSAGKVQLFRTRVEVLGHTVESHPQHRVRVSDWRSQQFRTTPRPVRKNTGAAQPEEERDDTWFERAAPFDTDYSAQNWVVDQQALMHMIYSGLYCADLVENFAGLAEPLRG
jgi:hypothetical protein